MQRQINNLERENANLTNQVREKDTRINGLRDELVLNAPKELDSTSRNQILQLQMQLQAAEDTSSRAKMETQRIREELEFANRNLATLQARMRDFENTVPNSQPVLSAAQLAEIDDLRSQNDLLKDQLASMSAVPGLSLIHI